MTTITQLTEIVNGSLVPSNKKLDGSLVQISTNVDNKLSVAEDGLFVSVPKVDLTPYYTSSQTDSAISAAIAQAQLGGGDTEVDLSGYATKAELAEYPKTADVLASLEEQAEGLESQIALKADVSVLSEYATKDDLSEAFNEITQGVPALVDTKLTTALTAYSTTAEISTLLGSFETGMGEQLANKVNLSELSNYTTTEDVDTQIDERFNNVYGPSLAANIQGVITQLDTKLDKPVETASETVTTPTVNSVPLYTIGNDGDYVLCTPDTWLKIGNFYVPAYTGATVGITS